MHTANAPKAARPNTARNHTDTLDDLNRAAFARAAVFQEFRRRDAVALDWDGFVDRRPDAAPQRFANGRAAT